jgi:hypothetical protein
MSIGKGSTKDLTYLARYVTSRRQIIICLEITVRIVHYSLLFPLKYTLLHVYCTCAALHGVITVCRLRHA